MNIKKKLEDKQTTLKQKNEEYEKIKETREQLAQQMNQLLTEIIRIQGAVDQLNELIEQDKKD